jgi:hypothetical protein
MRRYRCIGRLWLLLGVFAAWLLAATCACATEQPPPPVPYLGDADLNHDVTLDRLDFILFMQYWQTFKATGTVTTAIAGADFNKDGSIDRADAAHMIEQWILYGSTSTTTSAAK